MDSRLAKLEATSVAKKHVGFDLTTEDMEEESEFNDIDNWMMDDASKPKKACHLHPENQDSEQSNGSMFHPKIILCCLNSLEKELQIVKAGSVNSVIKFGKLGVSGIDGVHAWMTKQFGPQCYGLAFDVYVILEHIAKEEE
ncbi:hypothetical protein ACA910_007023 [Epithemia clementina (nom. ined.)]